MQASRMVVRVTDGVVWEADPEMVDRLTSSMAEQDGTKSDNITEFWRSGDLTVWRLNGTWAAAYRHAMTAGFLRFEDAARRAAALKEEIEGVAEATATARYGAAAAGGV